MRSVIAAAALVTIAACIATGEWIYVAYAGAVWFACTGWRPSWRGIPLPAPSPDPDAVEHARRLRTALLPACAISALLMAHALRRVIVAGDSLLAALLASLLTFGLFVAALSAHRQVEAATQREPRDG